MASFSIFSEYVKSKNVLIIYNNGFICIAARILNYRISATQDGAYNITQIL